MSISPVSSENLRIFANMADGQNSGETGACALSLIREFSNLKASRNTCQQNVGQITRLMLSEIDGNWEVENIVLLPVLRAGLAMWPAANRFLGYPPSCFVACSKVKGTDRVAIDWIGPSDLHGCSLLVLDTIIATGDTLNHVIQSAQAKNCHSIRILCCYAAPQGIQAIRRNNPNVSIYVGCLAESVDVEGYLVPATNGDMGDKLFN